MGKVLIYAMVLAPLANEGLNYLHNTFSKLILPTDVPLGVAWQLPPLPLSQTDNLLRINATETLQVWFFLLQSTPGVGVHCYTAKFCPKALLL